MAEDNEELAEEDSQEAWRVYVEMIEGLNGWQQLKTYDAFKERYADLAGQVKALKLKLGYEGEAAAPDRLERLDIIKTLANVYSII